LTFGILSNHFSDLAFNMVFRSALLTVLPSAFVNCDAVPSVMVAVQGSGVGCDKPDWSCISEKSVDVPSPSTGQVLLKMYGASVNPINVDGVESNSRFDCATTIGCSAGTLGNDGAGTVVEVGSSCPNFKVGDEVWGLIQGSYAQYAVANCKSIGLKPNNLDFVSAATIPVVGGTARACLLAAAGQGAIADGTVRPELANLTVAILSGQGGTGFMAVQLAKAMGANRVITSASGGGIDFVKALGADVVVDYHKQALADALENDSVDVVFDNFGVPGTADKIMHAIRPGGTFLVLMGGNGGAISDSPKEGVNQVTFYGGFGTTELDYMKDQFEAGSLSPRVADRGHNMAAVYKISEVPQAFTRSKSRGLFGKIAVVPSDFTAVVV